MKTSLCGDNAVSIGLRVRRWLVGLVMVSSGFWGLLSQPGWAATDVATFAGGCFWCVEAVYDAVPGVISTTSGFMGGKVANPTYEDVASQRTGHAEVVQVVFDPDQVSYTRLLDLFWRNIDPLDAYGQFCDRGSSYRSEIFTHSTEQQVLAEQSRQEVARYLTEKFQKPIATTITPASSFFAAEAYHQDYHQTHPLRYKVYRTACGRDLRLEAIWGTKTSYALPGLALESPRHITMEGQDS